MISNKATYTTKKTKENTLIHIYKVFGIRLELEFPAPNNKFELALQRKILAGAREHLLQWLPHKRPKEIRSVKYFGRIINPDFCLLDKGGLIELDNEL